MKLVSLAEAKAKGLKRYFTGRPCKRGHVVPRRVVSRTCVECLREYFVWYRRIYYYKNREKELGKARRWRQQNPERASEVQRAWCRRNRIIRNIIDNKRRARKLQNGGTFTPDDIVALVKAQRGRCAFSNYNFGWCLGKFNGANKAHIDHIQPLSAHGRSDPSNLQLLCKPCNSRKTNKEQSAFLREHGVLL